MQISGQARTSVPHGNSPAPVTEASRAFLRATLVVWLVILPLICCGVRLSAQIPIPPNARAAANLPQLASKLARNRQLQNASRVDRTANSRASHGPSRPACAPTRTGWLPEDYILYSNGPVNGTTDAWTINDGFVVADSFTVAGDSSVAGVNFGAWLFPGDVLLSVEISITSQPFGGTTYFDQTVSFTQSGCSGNQYGFNVCTESNNSINGANLSAGTYWVNLQNAVVNTGDPVYWDENSGPSSAAINQIGTIPSEAFSILGAATTTTTMPTNSCMPEQSWNFQVIHDFTGQGDGGSPYGVALDRAGNLYGPSNNWPDDGLVWKLTDVESGWILSPLYNFTSGNNGALAGGVIVGGDNILYGSAGGTDQNCNGRSCGLIFELRPEPSVCLSTSCSWMESLVYAFNGPNDAAGGGGLVADQAGNLYGTSGGGGANQHGAVFELTPSIGGWIETILYSFGSGDGGPTGVVVGNDGKLYGMTSWGGLYEGGVVYQLSPAPGGWTETVLYNLPNSGGIGQPNLPLVRDRHGNLFGEYYFTTCCADRFGVLFVLSPSNSQWVYNELWRADSYQFDYQILNNLTVGDTGILYATGTGYAGGCLNAIAYGFVLEFVPSGNGWSEDQPIFWGGTIFPTSGALGVDGQGNLYGTTYGCGAHNNGTVWQLSP